MTTEYTVRETLSVTATIHEFNERAELRLQGLLRSSASEDGYLYSVGECGIALIASVGSDAVPADIDEQARAYLSGAFAEDDLVTQSGDALDGPLAWRDARGHSYRAVLLQTPTGAGLTVTGLAVLASPRGDAFEYPTALALEMGRFACESTTQSE